PHELYALPVPVPGERSTEPRSRQALAGRLTLAVRRGGRTVFTGESLLAGPERGWLGPAGGGRPRPRGRQGARLSPGPPQHPPPPRAAPGPPAPRPPPALPRAARAPGACPA